MQDNMVSQNIIITERASTLRQLGRNALKGKWASAIISVLIYLLCMYVPTLIFNNLFGYNPGNIMSSTTGSEYTFGIDPQIYNEIYNDMPRYSMLSTAYILLVSGAFTLGICLFYLASFRGHNVGPKDIFLGFERFGKSLGLFLYQCLFVFLWSLLFIIPGIIASIRYSQAFFVLADDPEKSIRQCMDESKAMMKGNKAKYFLLGLSFIGWVLLCSIPGGILGGIVGSITTNAVAIGIASIIGNLFVAPVYAYIFSTMAGFYEILAGHLIKETAPTPLTPEQIEVEAPVEAIEEVIEDVEGPEVSQDVTEEPDALAEEAEKPVEAKEDIPVQELLEGNGSDGDIEEK